MSHRVTARGKIEDDQVPSSSVGPDRILNRRVHGRQLQRHHPQVVTVDSLFSHRVGGQLTQAATEKPIEVGDPLGREVRRAHNDRPLHQPQALHFPQVQTRHDGLAGARLVGQKKPQHRLRQHRTVHSGRLVRVRPQLSRRDRAGFRIGRRRTHPPGPHAGQHTRRVRGAVRGDLRDFPRLVLPNLDLVDAPGVIQEKHRPRRAARRGDGSTDSRQFREPLDVHAYPITTGKHSACAGPNRRRGHRITVAALCGFPAHSAHNTAT